MKEKSMKRSFIILLTLIAMMCMTAVTSFAAISKDGHLWRLSQGSSTNEVTVYCTTGTHQDNADECVWYEFNLSSIVPVRLEGIDADEIEYDGAEHKTAIMRLETQEITQHISG